MATTAEKDLSPPRQRLRVGGWELDPARNELRRDGEAVRLEPKAIEVLAYLARCPGEVIGREELLAAIWPGVVVGDDALTQAIIKLRKALGDDAHRPKYIETISKRGYRLIAPVEEASGAVPSAGPRVRARGAAVLILGLALVAAVLVVGKSVRMPWPLAGDTRGPAGSAMPIVAILPLANLSGDASRDYFSDGMTEDLINGLGRFANLRVMSRAAVQGFKGAAVTPQAIRSELGARYVVQGSVREAGGRVRVAVALSDAEAGTQLWSEQYDGEGAQVFDIQERIVRNIVAKLHVTLSELEQQRAIRQPPENLEAYDLVLRARALVARIDRAANREARTLLARASQLAPDYPEIYSVMAAAEFQRTTNGFVEDGAAATNRAEALAKQALSFSDQRAHSMAHSLLAAIYGHHERYQESLQHAERAIELNPSDAGALYWRGGALLALGRVEEAIPLLETARRYEPYPSPGRALNLSIAYYVAGRHADALANTDAILARHPRNVYLHAMRAAALAQLERLPEAAQAVNEVRRLNPAFQPDNFGTRFEDPKYKVMVREGLRKAGL